MQSFSLTHRFLPEIIVTRFVSWMAYIPRCVKKAQILYMLEIFQIKFEGWHEICYIPRL